MKKKLNADSELKLYDYNYNSFFIYHNIIIIIILYYNIIIINTIR